MLFAVYMLVPWILLIHGVISIIWALTAKVKAPTITITWIVALYLKVLPFIGGLACLFTAALIMGWI